MTNKTLKFKLRRMAHITAVVIVGFGFTACSKSMSQMMGIAKHTPDETLVTTNRPLSVPPDYALRPPTDAPQQVQPGPYIPPENQPLSAPPKNQPAQAQPPANQNGARPIAPLPSQLARQRAIRERATAQRAAAAQRPVTTASVPQQKVPQQKVPQQNAPTTLGQPVSTTPSQPTKRPTQAEYEAKIQQSRKDDLARQQAKNPNYGTWRNVWSAIWD